LVRWWIEGAQINWELGLAQLSGGYESPIMQKFITLAQSVFSNEATGDGARKAKAKAKSKK